MESQATTNREPAAPRWAARRSVEPSAGPTTALPAPRRRAAASRTLGSSGRVAEVGLRAAKVVTAVVATMVVTAAVARPEGASLMRGQRTLRVRLRWQAHCHRLARHSISSSSKRTAVPLRASSLAVLLAAVLPRRRRHMAARSVLLLHEQARPRPQESRATSTLFPEARQARRAVARRRPPAEGQPRTAVCRPRPSLLSRRRP